MLELGSKLQYLVAHDNVALHRCLTRLVLRCLAATLLCGREAGGERESYIRPEEMIFPCLDLKAVILRIIQLQS